MITKTKKFLSMIVATGAIFAGAGMAEATCTQQGKIATTHIHGSTMEVRLAVGDHPAYPDHYHQFNTRSFYQQMSLVAAVAGNHTVRIEGDKLACETEGKFRFAGNVIDVHVKTLE